MAVSLIFGKIGSNKSHFSCFYGIFLANKYKKKIVTNFLFHPDNLLEYCRRMRYNWLLQRFQSEEPVVYYCDLEKVFLKQDDFIYGDPIDYFLTINDSVCIFDEVALYFPARGSGAVSTKHSPFLKTLNQIRKRHILLLVTTQSHTQIDSSIRNLAEETFACAGMSNYSEVLKGPELFFKIVRRFIPENYDIWVNNPRLS